MALTPHEVARFIDVSALQTNNTEDEIQELIRIARDYHFICAFSLPYYLPTLVKAFEKDDILVGAPIGFPTGAEPTEVKVFQAKNSYKAGCDEFDMVMNIGALKSRRYDIVERDISEVYGSIGGKPLKVIVEAPYLTDAELETACKIVVESGAMYVKSGTGWAANPTELRHIEIMAKTVAGKIKIKAAGGIRNYATLKTMWEMGVSRFGIGMKSAVAIVTEAASQARP